MTTRGDDLPCLKTGILALKVKKIDDFHLATVLLHLATKYAIVGCYPAPSG